MLKPEKTPMNKIKGLTITGIRGIRETLRLEPGEQPVLLYGGNGTGKSSITDAVEWFLKDKVKHLTGEEIGRRGNEAIRNLFLRENEPASVSIRFSEEAYDSEKQVSIDEKKRALKSAHSNSSSVFKSYLEQSQKENLVLRRGDLEDFILATKKEKLEKLSEIIGFTEVSRARGTLLKTLNQVKRDIKNQGFDNRISQQQQVLIKHLGQNVTGDRLFLERVNELLKPLNLGRTVSDFGDVPAVLEFIKKSGDNRNLEPPAFYRELASWAADLPRAIDGTAGLYREYHQRFMRIIGDIAKLSKVFLEKLLDEGTRVLDAGMVTDDRCPLCLQPKKSPELLNELESRLHELKGFKEETRRLEEVKGQLKRTAAEQVRRLERYLQNKHVKHPGPEENSKLAGWLEQLKNQFSVINGQTDLELSPTSHPVDPSSVAVDKKLAAAAGLLCNTKLRELEQEGRKDMKFDVYGKILASREAYERIKELKTEKTVLEHRRQSLEIIYREFLKAQKTGLEDFFSFLSDDIDHYYQFMNPGEKVENIKLAPLEKDGELLGLTLEYSFFQHRESPPQKYLSESHLNALGIAFFLASVKAFNRESEFFILDDVVSGFDREHRKRFAELLIEEFSEYQVVVLTHEREWFDRLKETARGAGWLVGALHWDEDKGTHLGEG